MKEETDFSSVMEATYAFFVQFKDGTLARGFCTLDYQESWNPEGTRVQLDRVEGWVIVKDQAMELSRTTVATPSPAVTSATSPKETMSRENPGYFMVLRASRICSGWGPCAGVPPEAAY